MTEPSEIKRLCEEMLHGKLSDYANGGRWRVTTFNDRYQHDVTHVYIDFPGGGLRSERPHAASTFAVSAFEPEYVENLNGLVEERCFDAVVNGKVSVGTFGEDE